MAIQRYDENTDELVEESEDDDASEFDDEMLTIDGDPMDED